MADRVVPSRRQRGEERERRRAVAAALGDTILSGPFVGMRRSSAAAWTDEPAPYILGSYEAELHSQIERAISRSPSVVVDIGCAEGYYAVGLAMRLPTAHVYASDVLPTALAGVAENARLNGVVDRVTPVGALGHEELQAILAPGALVFCDCEGCEVDLLNPDLVPRLRESHLIVELHDFLDITISSRLKERFAATHVVEIVDVCDRTPSDYPWISAADFGWATFEHRPVEPHPMQWAIMTPKEQRPPTSA